MKKTQTTNCGNDLKTDHEECRILLHYRT